MGEDNRLCICSAGGRGSGVSVSGDLGEGGTRGHHSDDELAFLGVDHGVSESAIMQGVVGPDHGSRSHH